MIKSQVASKFVKKFPSGGASLLTDLKSQTTTSRFHMLLPSNHKCPRPQVGFLPYAMLLGSALQVFGKAELSRVCSQPTQASQGTELNSCCVYHLRPLLRVSRLPPECFPEIGAGLLNTAIESMWL